jgi:hypothetical protein
MVGGDAGRPISAGGPDADYGAERGSGEQCSLFQDFGREVTGPVRTAATRAGIGVP